MLFFRAIRQAVRDRKKAEADACFWKAEAQRLAAKLEERSDLFIEREFRLMDRFLTTKAKTHAITDEIAAKAIIGQPDERYLAQQAAYLEEKKQDLIRLAKQANVPNYQEVALRDFERNYERYIVDFQQNLSVM